MHWPIVIKVICSGMLISSVFLAGCAVNNVGDDMTDHGRLPVESVADLEFSEPTEDDLWLEHLVHEADAHYERGCEYYQAGDWDRAERAFDRALETLLEADVDAEMHYKLGKAYNSLFYKIHKFALQQSYLNQAELADGDDEIEVDVEELTFAEDLVIDGEDEEIDDYPIDTLGTFRIDPSDPDIQKYLQQFSHARSQYRIGIERGARYLPMIREIFAQYKLPQELMYVPLIESNFRVDAVSPAGAVGLWQFISSTGKNYGLKNDKWVDERRDPEKSTAAAARYLTDLYDMLGDWDLALSGYYMGEYKVHKAIGQHRTRDIAALAQTKAFGAGAKQYVNRIKAAALIAMNSEDYDIHLDDITPLRYDTIDVARGKRLSDIAKELGISATQLKDLNPELKTTTTPSGSGRYTLKIPSDAGLIMLAEQRGLLTEQSAAPVTTAAAPTAAQTEYVVHRVKRGETLAKISRQYGVNVKTLQSFNQIRDARALQIGQAIRVPSAGIAAPAQVAQVITHVVEKGENLAQIAKRYNVNAATLQTYNNIRDVRRLQIGQELHVPLSGSSVLAKTQEKRLVTYQVKRGDSLSKIASTFGVSVSQLQEWNNVKGSLIHPGSRIKVWY
jgi:membrane-bound lytic murein transglycosylase D